MIELLNGMTNEGSEGHIGWFENRQTKLKEIIESLCPINLIEIGFNMGHSCKLICDTILELRENDIDYRKHQINFFVFDNFPHAWSRNNFRILMGFYKEKGIELSASKGSTVDTLDLFFTTHNGLFDFIEVDGSHIFDIAHSDILNVYNKVRAGGVLYIDDYTPTEINSGVVRAVDAIDWIGHNTEATEDIFLAIKK